jgi:hypothetical protein
MANDDQSQEFLEALKSREQDPRVARGLPTVESPVRPELTLVGFWGNSGRDEYRRLYLVPDLTVYVEFHLSFVVDSHVLSPDQSPFPGETATTVTLKWNAEFQFSRTLAYTSDEWHLDPPVLNFVGQHPAPHPNIAYSVTHPYCPPKG